VSFSAGKEPFSIKRTVPFAANEENPGHGIFCEKRGAVVWPEM
jgi:hypothetical protein